jgi:hypothetical protein
MATSDSNEKLVFNVRTLRLIIGALAFAFPCAVIALTGQITNSISASYHEVQSRNVFVGFMFVVGSLLVSYKGHRLIISNREGSKLWVLAKRYEEDLVSILGGVAAIAAALSPTACNGCAIDTQAIIHLVGAFVLFAAVVYFCLVAFLRRVNQKLVHANSDFGKLMETVRKVRALRDVHSMKELGYWLLPESAIFLSIAKQVWMDYDRIETFEKAGVSTFPTKPTKLVYMWLAYKKKITRGFIYLVCGSLIALVLLAFLAAEWSMSGLVKHSTLTFWVETVALGLFGVAWMTASQLQYIRKIGLFLKLRRPKTRLAPQLGDI